MVIEHPVRAGWKLAKDVTPAETTPSFHRFRVPVESKKTTALVVNEAHPLDTRYQITNLTDDQIALFLRQKTINAEVEAALRRIVAQNDVVAALPRKSTRATHKSRKSSTTSSACAKT